MIFPLEDSPVFLSALIPTEGEPWIYTRGITLALDYLGISFQQALDWLLQVIVGLDSLSLVSKTVLDETLAGWILPLVPQDSPLFLRTNRHCGLLLPCMGSLTSRQ